jgi:hypothetical protein
MLVNKDGTRSDGMSYTELDFTNEHAMREFAMEHSPMLWQGLMMHERGGVNYSDAMQQTAYALAVALKETQERLIDQEQMRPAAMLFKSDKY